MSRESKSKQTRKLLYIDPRKVVVPEVRVTSQFEPEILEMFKKSIDDIGILNPIIVAKEGEKFILIDGLHRLEEAIRRRMSKIPAIVIEGGMKEVYLLNLATGVMHGKANPVEVLKVVDYLMNKEGLSVEEICKHTGYSRKYIEELYSITKAIPAVQDELERGRIKLGHAYHISRIAELDLEVDKKEAVQARLLAIAIQYQPTVKQFKEIVDETIRNIEEAKKKPPEPIEKQVRKEVEMGKCHFCEQEYPLKHLTGVVVCMSCYAKMFDLIQKEKARRKAAQALASTTVEPSTLVEP